MDLHWYNGQVERSTWKLRKKVNEWMSEWKKEKTKHKRKNPFERNNIFLFSTFYSCKAYNLLWNIEKI